MACHTDFREMIPFAIKMPLFRQQGKQDSRHDGRQQGRHNPLDRDQPGNGQNERVINEKVYGMRSRTELFLMVIAILSHLKSCKLASW